MDKLTTNNEFVAMRKAVRQARVHVIRKLVRQTKILKEKKSKTSESKLIEKLQHKAQKLGDDIIAIKKLEDDCVSKQALFSTSGSNHLQELSNPYSTAETRAIARLCLHKSITQRVLDFRAKFNNSHKTIEDMLAVGKKKQKKMQHIQAKKEIKERKQEFQSEEFKRAEWLRDNIPDLKEKKESNKATIVKNDSKIDVNKNIGKIVNTKRNLSEVNSKEVDCDIDNDSDGSEEDNIGNIVNTKRNLSEVNSEDVDSDQDNDSDGSEGVISNKKIKTEKTVDSFFLNCSGGKYLSNYVPKVTKDTVVDIVDGINRRERRAQKFGKAPKSKRREFVKDKLNKRNFSNSVENENNTNRTQKTYMSNEKLNKEQQNQKSDKLHPSWEAKKAPQIVAFQGKKITFED